MHEASSHRDLSSGRKSAIFLDRDGVLNRAYRDANNRPVPPRSKDEFVLLPGVIEACQRFRSAGFFLICVTNQPDLARGTADPELVEWMNDEVRRACCLDQVRTCPHDDKDGCHCRKPKPGLLVDAAHEFGLDLPSSVMIGDRYRDVEAGYAAGCSTVLVDYGYSERQPVCRPDLVVSSLSEATDLILSPPNSHPRTQCRTFPSR